MISRQCFHLQVNEAYSVLSDPQKKARYDRGEDIDGNGFSTAGDKISILLYTKALGIRAVNRLGKRCYSFPNELYSRFALLPFYITPSF